MIPENLKRAARLYMEAAVWSGATGNGMTGELIDNGYMDEIEYALNQAGNGQLDADLLRAAVKVAEDFERRGDGTGCFLGWRITCLTKDWRKFTGEAKFQVDESAFTTLLEAMTDIIARVPRAVQLIRLGLYGGEGAILEAAETLKVKTMNIDMEPIGLALTEFKDVSQGQPFLWAGELYVKATGIDDKIAVRSDSGYFAVNLATGDARTFPAATKVTLAETKTTVLRVLPK